MNDNSLVSVIIPMYNVEKYIGECIESVISQSYSNLEIIIVDDGSPDQSGEIAEQYAEKDKRIKVIHKKNSGVASARNIGFFHSNGEFITYIDSDDWVSKDYIEHLLFLQGVYDSDMCMTTKVFSKKTDIPLRDVKVDKLSAEDAAVLLLSPRVVVGSWNKLYRRQWLIDNKIIQNEKLFSGEGLNYIVYAAQFANSVTISNQRIYFYRRNVSESATTKFNLNMFLNNELSLDDINKNKRVESEKFNIMLELFRCHLMINGILAIHTHSNPKEYLEEYRRWRHYTLKNGLVLLKKREVPMRSKIRIICVCIAPRLCAKFTQIKRRRAFENSV